MLTGKKISPYDTNPILIALIGLAVAVIAITLLVSKVHADVSSYTASSFAQYCSQNSNICNKVDASTVSCPNQNQTISQVFVHAGDGQTVYVLPDPNWSEVLSTDESTVQVSPVGQQHGISWVAVICNTLVPSSTPTASPSATPLSTPVISPTPVVTGTPNPTKSPDPTPTPQPNTPSCGQDEHLNLQGDKCLKWELGGAPTPPSIDPKVTRLGNTGTSLENISLAIIGLGTLLVSISIIGINYDN